MSDNNETHNKSITNHVGEETQKHQDTDTAEDQVQGETPDDSGTTFHNSRDTLGIDSSMMTGDGARGRLD